MEITRLLIVSLLTLVASSKPILSLSVLKSPNFDSDLALFGDAKTTDGGSSVQLNRPTPSSSGLLTQRNPINFIKTTSFSADFSFSISPHSGDGLALLIAPADFPGKLSRKTTFGISRGVKFVGVEFDTSMDANVGDENANHVGVDVSSLVSSRVSNVSSLNLVLNSGVKLRSWVDYEASSKRLEIRLSEMGSARPYNPLMAFPIDLSEMWRGEKVFVGISSSSGNSEQISSLYSYNFRVRVAPNWMHSLPVDPRVRSDKGRERREEHKTPCPLAMLSGMILAIGCGTMVAFMMMFLWTMFVNRLAVIPGEYSLHPADFRYEKVSVTTGNVK